MANKRYISTNPRFIDLTGKRFGRLLVIEYAGFAKTKAMWHCQCDCGSCVTLNRGTLVDGTTQSCGCLQRELTSSRSTKHKGGRINVEDGRKAASPELKIYQGMLRRCSKPNHHRYHYYGGRGIRVCDRWLNGNACMGGFECFLEDMGPRPSRKHSIERENNEGDYDPGNCHWATIKEQANNKRDNRYVLANGAKRTASQWATVTGIGAATIISRLNKGWSPEDAVTRPVRKIRKRTAP